MLLLQVLILLAGAVLVFVAGRTDKPILLAAGQVWTGLHVLAGGLALLAVRPLLDFALRSRTEHLAGMENEDFCLWAMGKFDRFLIGSLFVTGLVLWGMLWVKRQKNEKDFVWRHFYGVGYACMAILLVAAVWYGIGTINKMFDLAIWITGVALAECGVLYLPLFLRLRQVKKQKNPVQ